MIHLSVRPERPRMMQSRLVQKKKAPRSIKGATRHRGSWSDKQSALCSYKHSAARKQRILEVQAAIAAGTYSIPAEKLASKMLDRAFWDYACLLPPQPSQAVLHSFESKPMLSGIVVCAAAKER